MMKCDRRRFPCSGPARRSTLTSCNFPSVIHWLRGVHTSRLASRLGLCLLSALVLLPAGCRANQNRPQQNLRRDEPKSKAVLDRYPVRAVWVVRETYDSPEEIAALMASIQEAGLNTVVYQVRGNATAWYRSKIEPFAYEYETGDPGFDPFAVACEEAHKRGLAIHAWANVMPAWRDHLREGKPPEDPDQLYNRHPDWLLVDDQGNPEPIPKSFYVNVNPCLPEVRQYLVSVMAEIVGNYPVDGLHLDYIRFVMDLVPKERDYPRDARTLELYRQATGLAPEDNPAAWAQWKRDQVTRLVREIRARVKKLRPEAQLTVAAAPNIERARSTYYQDASAWLSSGWVDAVYIMNYTPDTELYRERRHIWLQMAGGGVLVQGLGVYMHKDPATTIAQLALTEEWGEGFCLFSNNSLFTPGGQAHLEAIQPMLLEMRERSIAMQERVMAERRGTNVTVPMSPASQRDEYGVVP